MKSPALRFPSRARRSGFTLIELLVVIGIIAILASLAFPVTQAVLNRAYKLKAQAMVKDLQVAINNYLTEYNRLPQQGDAETPTPTNGGSQLIGILMGESSGQNSMNPRGIVFLNANTAKNNRGGIVDNGGAQISLVDQWGNPYYVVMDGNYDNKIANPDVQSQDQTISQGAPPQLRTRVAVYCIGPDGQLNTKDDIVSWR
jgi:prepilin-type N-terminal cleavage/methylation domain-containing protein